MDAYVYIYIYIYMHIYLFVYIYIYTHTHVYVYGSLIDNYRCTPSPPTKSFPTKSPRVELSGRHPIRLYGHDNSHPLDLRVCLSRTL